MNQAALFCDGTESYVIPPEPEMNSKVTIRFRTAKNDRVKVFLLSKGEGQEIEDSQEMEKECTEREFDYYSIRRELGEEPFRYFFMIQDEEDGSVCYYNRCGVSGEIEEYYDFEIVPGFSTPDWAKGAVMYQIYTDRFYNGDPSNDVETREYYYIGGYSSRVTDWSKYPEKMGVREFYGGDLQGVIDKLDYLHKYDIQDYDYIDPHLGVIVEDGGEVLPEGVTDNSQASRYQKRVTSLKNLEASNQLFIRLVEELHKRGMKIILDGVFNHCGSFNKWMDRERIYEGQENYEPGAYISKESPYRSYFRFISKESPYRSYFRFFKEGDADWPYNGNYDGWWGHDTLPKLNYEESAKLENYILSIGKKWVSPPYNVDGWRLDVAADLGRSSEYNQRPDPGRALWRSKSVAAGRRVGFGHELRCIYGASDLVSDRHGEAQRRSPGRTVRERGQFCQLHVPSYVQYADPVFAGGHERTFQSRPFQIPDPHEPHCGQSRYAGAKGRRRICQQSGYAGSGNHADDLGGRAHHLLRR